MPTDRLGRPMNPAQMPDFRRGVTPPNAGKKYPPEPLTRDEVARLYRACGRGVTGERHKALIATGVYTGLRDMELRGLELRDVDLADGVLRVREGKGRKARVLGVNDELVAMMERWLAVRAKCGAPPRSGPFFCTLTRGSFGRPLCESAMRNTLPRLGQRAEIEKRVHMHGLRHTFADWQLRAGTNLVLLKEMLGHVDLRVTERYASHLRPREVIERMQGRLDPLPAGDLAQQLAGRPDIAAQLAALLVELGAAA